MFDLSAQCSCAIEQTGSIFEDIVAIVLAGAGEQRLKSNVLIILELGIQLIASVKTLHGRHHVFEEWTVVDWSQE